MHWDPNELKSKYDELTKKYNQEKKPLNKNYLWNDRITYATMFSLYKEDNIFDEDYNIANCQDQACIDYMFEHLSQIIRGLNDYLTIRYNNRRPENLKIKDYDELITNFLKDYYPDMKSIYNDLKKQKHIELTTNKNFEPGYNGECFYSMVFDDLYIFSRYNRKILSSGYLPHELGHAYQTKTFESNKDMGDKIQSFFIEVYSTYVERLFHLYLNDLGYTDQALYLEKKYWQAFLEFTEFQLYFIFNKKNFFGNDYIKYILSKLVSNIVFDEYLKNNNHNAIDHFNKLFKEKNDLAIVKEYSLKRILKSANSSFDRILNKNSIK